MSIETEFDCQFSDCDQRAEYYIISRRDLDKPPWSQFAGPDHYQDETHSCKEHVSELLGCQVDCVDPANVFWHITPMSMTTEPR